MRCAQEFDSCWEKDVPDARLGSVEEEGVRFAPRSEGRRAMFCPPREQRAVKGDCKDRRTVVS